MGAAKRAYLRALIADPCAYCGARSEAPDHIEPRHHGGTDDWENLTGTCQSCNSSKGKRTLLAHLLRRTWRSDVERVEAFVAGVCSSPQDRAIVLRAHERIASFNRRLAGVGV